MIATVIISSIRVKPFATRSMTGGLHKVSPGRNPSIFYRSGPEPGTNGFPQQVYHPHFATDKEKVPDCAGAGTGLREAYAFVMPA